MTCESCLTVTFKHLIIQIFLKNWWWEGCVKAGGTRRNNVLCRLHIPVDAQDCAPLRLLSLLPQKQLFHGLQQSNLHSSAGQKGHIRKPHHLLCIQSLSLKRVVYNTIQLFQAQACVALFTLVITLDLLDAEPNLQQWKCMC